MRAQSHGFVAFHLSIRLKGLIYKHSTKFVADEEGFNSHIIPLYLFVIFIVVLHRTSHSFLPFIDRIFVDSKALLTEAYRQLEYEEGIGRLLAGR